MKFASHLTATPILIVASLLVVAVSATAAPAHPPRPRIIDANAPGAPITVFKVSDTRSLLTPKFGDSIPRPAAGAESPSIDVSQKQALDGRHAAAKPPAPEDATPPPLGVAAPANDLCANAMSVTLPFTVTENTQCATTSPTDPSPCGFQNSASVWFTVTPATPGIMQLDTCAGTSYDSVLSVYVGDCSAGLANVACNDDSCALQSRVAVPIAVGTTYIIQVQAYSVNAGGNLVLSGSLAAPLGNDGCQSPTQLPSFGPFPIVRNGNSTTATTEPTDPLQACSAGGPQQNGNSIWFSWVAPIDGTVTLESCGSGYDTVVSLFTGSCGSFNELACNDDRGSDPNAPSCANGLSSFARANVTTGVYYTIELTDWATPGGGSYVLSLDFRATPDPAANSPAVVEDGWTVRFRNLLGAGQDVEDYRFNPDLVATAVDAEDLTIVQRFKIPKEGLPNGANVDYFFVEANPSTAANPTGEDISNPPPSSRVPVVIVNDVFYRPDLFPPASGPYIATVAFTFNSANAIFPASPGPSGERRYDWFSVVEFAPAGPFLDGGPPDLDGDGDFETGVVFRYESGTRNLYRITARTDNHGAELTDYMVNRSRRSLSRLNVFEAHPPQPVRDFPVVDGGEDAETRPWAFVLN
ncbi:MAG: hypothetical protein HYR85_26600 [Planctomycetes bacterium]|nr:hypothetical protein [Planctomycetota bacterium]MBI3842996.1 hypothetical protein [Planctomycetota bacterium]